MNFRRPLAVRSEKRNSDPQPDTKPYEPKLMRLCVFDGKKIMWYIIEKCLSALFRQTASLSFRGAERRGNLLVLRRLSQHFTRRLPRPNGLAMTNSETCCVKPISIKYYKGCSFACKPIDLHKNEEKSAESCALSRQGREPMRSDALVVE